MRQRQRRAALRGVPSFFDSHTRATALRRGNSKKRELDRPGDNSEGEGAEATLQKADFRSRPAHAARL